MFDYPNDQSGLSLNGRTVAVFSAAEINRRLDMFYDRLQSAGIDGAFIQSADNVYYLSGVPLLSEWGRPMYLGVGASGASRVVAAALERENAQHFAPFGDVHVSDDSSNVWRSIVDATFDHLANVCPADGVIGVELPIVSHANYEALKERLPRAQIVDVSPVLNEMRIIKSDEELNVLRAGARLAIRGAEAFVEAVRDGVSELEVAAAAVAEIDREMAKELPDAATSSYAYAQFGNHTLTPHLHPTGRRLERGELVALNVFPVVSGYCMELERTYVYGEGTEDQQRILAAVTETHQRCKRMVGTGVRLAEIDGTAQQMLTLKGLRSYVRHGTGHAHGIMIGSASREELGEVRTYNENVFKPGMITSIEPGVYVPGIGGFRHSDVLIVSNTDAECITEFPIGWKE